MSYLVLARKYRPQLFEDVVGQAHVTRTLANAIEAERVAHAYLFCGPRGVGKTTAARILAKALNCAKGPSATPCNKCERCTEITDGRSFDVLEIDGASNRGIDEVRELRENTRYAAASGGYKVYIIDEVHMLTKEAFNALLKTLEEPPSHVIFVLATTDPFKLPATILSRVQRFDFARIATRDIAGHLKKLMKKEKIKADDDALALVARRAQGGLRDALSLMDQILSASEGKLDRPAVENLLGLVGEEFLFSLVDAIADQDAARTLSLLHETYTQGADLEEVAKGLTAHLRDLFILSVGSDLGDLVDASDTSLERYQEQTAKFNPETLSRLLDYAATASATLRRSENPRLTLELALADMARLSGLMPMSEIVERVLALEERLGGVSEISGSVAAKASPAKAKASAAKKAPSAQPVRKKKDLELEAPEPVADRAPPKSAPVSAAQANSEGSEAAPAGGAQKLTGTLWDACLESLKTKNIRLWGTLHGVKALIDEDSDSFQVKIGERQNALQREAFSDPKTVTLLESTLKEVGAPNPKVMLGDIQEGAVDPEAKAPEDERGMGEVMKDEPIIQKVIDMFKGDVLP